MHHSNMDEEFKAEVKEQLRDLHVKVDQLILNWEGGKKAAAIVRWFFAVGVGCAGAMAWISDRFTIK